MEEAEARTWVQERFDVPRETMARLDSFVDLLCAENERQNLVSRGTLQTIWARHIADSAQLVQFAPSPQATWIDFGSGAGFPGLIVAVLHQGSVTLVEERRLRIAFLAAATETLGLRVELVGQRLERVNPSAFDVISARAFAPLGRIFDLGARFSTRKTVWVLPKGRNAQSELEALDSSWQGEFRLHPSRTDPEARILVATGVHRGSKGKSR